MKAECLLLTVFLLTLLKQYSADEECPILYQRYNSNHTYCMPPSEECNVIAANVSAEDIATILKHHNEYRSRIAVGNETTGDLPQAADMLQMVWDDELASVAQKHADQCKFEHDCSQCRRVPNFEVGQNLYSSWTFSDSIPSPKWDRAVKAWYDEVEDFNNTWIKPFKMTHEPQVGHFTQVGWANTWRVGCGYVMHKEETEKETSYVQLYTCNYGPAGNEVDGEMYRTNDKCSHCPDNACCDESCELQNVTVDYPGLCKILNGHGPQYKLSHDVIFYCDFSNNTDDSCERNIEGVDQWKVTHSLSGSYIGIVLDGGESSTLTFKNGVHGQNGFCFSAWYRKGPNSEGDEGDNTATMNFLIPKNGYQATINFQNNSSSWRKFLMQIQWEEKTQLSAYFAVANGTQSQYFELTKLSAKEGHC